MTREQEKHLDDLNDMFIYLNTRKYQDGAEEHPGTLEGMAELDLVDNALEETLDGFNYLATLRTKVMLLVSDNHEYQHQIKLLQEQIEELRKDRTPEQIKEEIRTV